MLKNSSKFLEDEPKMLVSHANPSTEIDGALLLGQFVYRMECAYSEEIKSMY